jgi:Mrp family chromosome partitioning ATPase
VTEHSKIPLPPEGEPGRSLFERAEGAFGSFGGLKAAPVPAELAPAANRRAPVKPAMQPVPDFNAHGRERPEIGQPDLNAADHSGAREASFERVAFSADPQAIDRTRLREQGLIVPESQVTGLLEEFRIVKRQILLAARDARTSGGGVAAQRVLVCSPLPGEGKTFCATNLALAIAAEKDSEVVLVDADFAKPSILSLLGLSGGKGLMDALSDPNVAVEDCVLPTDVHGLYVLPAGNPTSSDSEFLSSHRTTAVLDRLTQGAPTRMVIFDSPPALAASPAAELAKYVGQALVICRADRTGKTALEDALSLLSGCRDIKLLLNSAHFSPSGRRFGDYYGYGG